MLSLRRHAMLITRYARQDAAMLISRWCHALKALCARENVAGGDSAERRLAMRCMRAPKPCMMRQVCTRAIALTACRRYAAAAER